MRYLTWKKFPSPLLVGPFANGTQRERNRRRSSAFKISLRAVREPPLQQTRNALRRDKTLAMNSSMRTTILWLHAVGGVAWVGAATVFVFAAGTLDLEDDEGLAMVRRLGPAINRLGLFALLFIVVSGIVNIYIAGVMRKFAFSNSFIELLAIKIALLSAMYVLLTQSWRLEAKLASADLPKARAAARRLVTFNFAVMGLGATALLLGLWLLGS
jgi:hypothetical protein